jgi:dTMP kinase
VPRRYGTIDGPGGSGKTVTTAALADMLRGQGRPVHLTKEPSAGPVGVLTRALVNEVNGHALACLVAADRYHHLDTEIRPKRAAGHVVVCDRYLASTLVLQARDGLTISWLLTLNEAVDLPDLAVILTASPQVITARLDQRGRHDRFEYDPRGSRQRDGNVPGRSRHPRRAGRARPPNRHHCPEPPAGSQPDRRRTERTLR